MITIDIVEQLVPNPITMLVQLCSTLILFLVAKKFLWKSVKNWIDARGDKMQEDLAASEKAKQEALADRQNALSQLNEASGKANEIVEAAVKEASSQKQMILEQANQEADATKKKAHAQIEAERQQMYEDLRTEMVDVAMEAAKKLVGNQDVEKLDAQAIEAFVKEASND